VIEPPHRLGPFSPAVSPARSRLRAAIVALAGERGLADVEAGELCERAAFGRARFEREFGDVAGCALQVYRANIAEFDRALEAAVDPAAPWRERLRASAYATARHVLRRPASTRFDMLAVLALGEPAQAHRDRYVRGIIDLIDEGRGEMADPAALGRATAESTFGAIYRTLARELARGTRPARAEELVPQLLYVALRPYLGPETAAEELAIAPPALAEVRCAFPRGGPRVPVAVQRP
jgi:hypothetical protein